MVYDIIGDIHGEFDKFHMLMNEMGYVVEGGVYVHPEGYKPLSIGDLVDKGPQQRRTIETFRRMIEQGVAEGIMGNHEFNAICMSMIVDGKPIRPHIDKNFKQHEAFLAEYAFGSPEHESVIAFFKTLPIFKETDDFRAIHAFWSDEDMANIRPYLNDDNTLSDRGYEAYARKEQPLRSSLDNVLKGPILKLPEGTNFLDKQGHARDEARHLWWVSQGSDPLSRIDVRGAEISEEARAAIASTLVRSVFEDVTKPTFFGHYSLPGSQSD